MLASSEIEESSKPNFRSFLVVMLFLSMGIWLIISVCCGQIGVFEMSFLAFCNDLFGITRTVCAQ